MNRKLDAVETSKYKVGGMLPVKSIIRLDKKQMEAEKDAFKLA